MVDGKMVFQCLGSEDQNGYTADSIFRTLGKSQAQEIKNIEWLLYARYFIYYFIYFICQFLELSSITHILYTKSEEFIVLQQ